MKLYKTADRFYNPGIQLESGAESERKSNPKRVLQTWVVGV